MGNICRSMSLCPYSDSLSIDGKRVAFPSWKGDSSEVLRSLEMRITKGYVGFLSVITMAVLPVIVPPVADTPSRLG